MTQPQPAEPDAFQPPSTTRIQTALVEEEPRRSPERQHQYAKRVRSSFHTWSYGQLTQCIKSCAARVGIPVEQGRQPPQADLAEQALQVALHAYYLR